MAAAAWTPLGTSPGTSNNPHILPKPPLSFAEIVSGKGDPASPRTASKSFSSIFENGGSLPVKSPGMFKGEPALFFSKEEIEKLSSPFRFTLIGKFSYWRPSMDVIRKFFNSLGLKSLKSVGLIHDNHVVIFISNQEDYSRLMFKSTWYVNGAPLKISNWSPDFLPFYDSPVVPVWLGFPGLPLHFFEKSVLFSLASVFGSPLKTDEPTALLTRPTVARVCVDVDVSKPRGNRIWLGDEKVGFWQEVVFENPPLFCSFCQKLGHEVGFCFVKNPELKKEKNPPTKILEKQKNQFMNKNEDVETLTWKEKSYPSNEENNSDGVKGSKVVKDVNTGEDEGEWLTQKSKRKKKNKNVVDNNQIPAPKETPSLGVALTPLNPLFLAKLSNTQGLHKIQPSVPTVESSSQMASQFKEKTSVFFPAQPLVKEIDTQVHSLPKNSNISVSFVELQAGGSLESNPSANQPSKISQLTYDKNTPSAICPQNALCHSKKDNLAATSPTSCILKNSKPLDSFNPPKASSKPLPSPRNGRDTGGYISHSVVGVSRLEKLEPLISDGKDLIQPLMSGNDIGVREIQPSLIASGDHLDIDVREFQPSLIASGDHLVLCSEELIYEPNSSSLPCTNGVHMLNNQPLIVHNLQPQPINCLALENENSFQPPNVTRGFEVVNCEFNMAPSILEEFGPDSSQELSHSSGPVLVDDMSGPNAIIVVNPKGQVDNKNEGFNRSQNFLAHGSKVTLPFNINHIQSLLLSFLADHGVVVRPPLHKALVEFSTILENSFDDSWEISWLFFQENLFRFFRSSEVTIPKKTRRILKFFFQVATEKNWPLSNTKGKMPVVEDGISDTDEST